MWKKTGRFFNPKDYGQTHAQMPTPLLLDDRLRVYYSTRDGDGCSYGTYVDVHPETMEVLYVRIYPVLEKGEPGAFDDSGAMPSCVIDDGGIYRLFYVGWNRCPEVRYRLAIGVASSFDPDCPFVKAFNGPVMDRSITNPYWVSSPCVLNAGGEYEMWYVSCTGWQEHDGMMEPGYNIHRASSSDGINWKPEGFCLHDRYAVSRPCVLYHNGMYKMWYSHRAGVSYRTDPSAAYQIGVATSLDGYNWRIGTSSIGISDDGWDSQMMCYPYVYEYKNSLHMLYNGNGFGQTGIGHAIWT